MTCEETRQTLSIYVDDCVSLPTRVAIDEHLDRCPVCRDEAIELRSLTRGLKLMMRPVPPAGLAETITDLLTIEAAARQAPKLSFGRRVTRFLEPRLMPYTVGSFASVILFFLMFTALRPHFVALREAALNNSSDFYTVRPVPVPGYEFIQPVAEQSFADLRAPFGEESPSLNPGGALAALTGANPTSHATYHRPDADDMIVKVTVYSNGAASLSDVVKAPRDRRMLDNFESALRQDAPFVRASYDRRPDTMSVVLTFGMKVEYAGQNF